MPAALKPVVLYSAIAVNMSHKSIIIKDKID